MTDLFSNWNTYLNSFFFNYLLVELVKYTLKRNVQLMLSEPSGVTEVWQFTSTYIPIKYIFRDQIPLPGRANTSGLSYRYLGSYMKALKYVFL